MRREKFMVLGFKRQPNKEANARQSGRTRQQEQRPLTMRSPALDSIERRQSAQPQQPRRRATGTARRSAVSPRRMRYAAEETLVRPEAPRKKLPPLKSKSGIVAPPPPQQQRHPQQRTGQTGSWRVWAPERQDEALQVISEEEQKKLAELELNMRLPRVAGKIDSWLLIIVLALLCVGLVMVYSSSAFVAARTFGDASYYFQRQLISVVLGLVAMLVTMRVDYRQWRRFSLIGMCIVLPMLLLVLKFGRTAYGASRWLSLGSFFSFQPSELTKLLLALYIADWLARKGNKVSTFLYGLAPFVILVGIVLGLVLLENDMGTAIIIAGFATAMFFTAGANIVQFLLAMACGGLIFLKEAFKPYRYLRLVGFMNPFNHVTDINLQLYQSLLAFGSGGWLGLGLGASRQKTGYLPLPFTDSILAITGEELGFIGCAVIVLLFLFLAFRGFRMARRTQDIYGGLLATGITTWLVLQAMINVGASTGSIPYTGVPLPFISYGGSSLVISLAAVGVLLNISKYIQEPATPALSRSLTIKMKK
ncbi:MAG TPA: putative lipid II flippase FtsW [Ktedonobacteraceae bacterium]|nr:putative lipid II flippase FtsW [Ktedonobacteraceae bacterium]